MEMRQWLFLSLAEAATSAPEEEEEKAAVSAVQNALRCVRVFPIRSCLTKGSPQVE
jgi:hypothetical protein